MGQLSSLVTNMEFMIFHVGVDCLALLWVAWPVGFTSCSSPSGSTPLQSLALQYGMGIVLLS